MRTRKLIVFLLSLFAFLLQACGPGVEAAIATGIAQTQQISELQTAAAGGGADAGQPTITETPDPGLAFVSVSQNTNCRSGPRGDYILLTTINVGQQVEVLKTFSDEYVLVKNPNGAGDCWLFLRFANTTDFSAFNLEIATQPPTPTPTNTPKPTEEPAPSFDWSGTWTFYFSNSTVQNASINQSGNSVSGSFFGILSFSGFLQNASINQSGNSVSVSFTNFGESSYTFNGSLSTDQQTAFGTWEVEGGQSAGVFTWQINQNNTNQFVGNFTTGAGQTGPWCGSRGGASKPNPCLGP